MAPRLISDADFNRKLNAPDRNREHTLAFLAKGVEPFSLPGYVPPAGYRLVVSLDGKQCRLLKDDITAYAVKIVTGKFVVPGKQHCTQVMVWRTFMPEYQDALQGLAKRIFAWLLEMYEIVVSDNEQTADGRRFWEYRITEAIADPRFEVMIWDGTKEDNELTLIQNAEEFVSKWSPYAWGTDPEIHQHRLLVISKIKAANPPE
ncbi:hypothetical protein [Buttiauxella massiliensis]|uniref:hypothetical protein n=1 Tax=Buttiauxella massiliensis TaxID=2831590 RepID=UPI00125F60C6|nr:hypothetical protein [Buttiauxella massiliensis]